jgi:hypothetical protein
MKVMQRLCAELEPVVELVSGPTKDGKSIIAVMVAKVTKK